MYSELCNKRRPVRYGYVEKAFDLKYYQTVFANIPGSAEMPSAWDGHTLRPSSGFTRLYIHPQRGVFAVAGCSRFCMIR